VPTLDQSGMPGFDASTVIGMFVPAGTPRDIIQRLDAALIKALASPALKERLASQGAEARPSTSEELASSCARTWQSGRRWRRRRESSWSSDRCA
jgi:tripartite-type tricarboxylate transporter receptor subunit TctC